ncbi:actin-3-like isoform X2 [Dreissena polymorpha]|uniref:actin-3-like isoform X2 n=1 Tax=Dreissena polymorpha TaxID=45954 RepID=UPI002263FF4B|nr:actin-3-like isoform X2 [Dreissena polymorpha]
MEIIHFQGALPPDVSDALFSVLDAEDVDFDSSSSEHSNSPCDIHLEVPIEHGLIADWEAMVDMLELTFKDRLAVDPKDHPILITESPVNPAYLREKLTEIMFETFGTPGLYVKDTSVLSLFSVGLDNGIVVESGHASTYTSVVHDGVVLRNTIPKTFYSGNDVTKYVMRMLSKKSECKDGNDIIAVAKAVKESICFVSEDFSADLKLAQSMDIYERLFDLPNGKQISLNLERMFAGECLFRPEIFGCNCPGLHRQVGRTLNLANPDIRRSVCQNVVLSGGNTLFPGLSVRLQMELNRLIPCSYGVKVLEYPDKQHYAAWIGGSKMASSDDMLTRWISKEDYECHGAAIVNKKCTLSN